MLSNISEHEHICGYFFFLILYFFIHHIIQYYSHHQMKNIGSRLSPLIPLPSLLNLSSLHTVSSNTFCFFIIIYVLSSDTLFLWSWKRWAGGWLNKMADYRNKIEIWEKNFNKLQYNVRFITKLRPIYGWQSTMWRQTCHNHGDITVDLLSPQCVYSCLQFIINWWSVSCDLCPNVNDLL